MATGPTRPALRERFERRRNDVVLGAARVFAQHGYDQTSMQQLADELGVAAGGLYHYFSGKEDLLVAICDDLMDPILSRVRELVADGTDPAEQLRSVVRLWVRHVVEHRDHVLVFQQERHVFEHGDQWRGIRASRKSFERLVGDLLDRVAGLRVSDRRLALSALLGMVNHTAQWYRPRGHLTPEQIADGYVELLLSR